MAEDVIELAQPLVDLGDVELLEPQIFQAQRRDHLAAGLDLHARAVDADELAVWIGVGDWHQVRAAGAAQLEQPAAIDPWRLHAEQQADRGQRAGCV